MEYSLNTNWKLYYAKNENCKEYAYDIKSYKDLDKLNLKPIKANVPGDFISDIYANGLIDNPLYGDNAWKLQKYEAMHVWYSCNFTYNFSEDDYIVFDGIDTISDVYLDGEKVLHTDNMFIPYKIGGNNKHNHELLIHIIPSVIEAMKYKVPAQSNALWYNYQSMFIRKSAYMFGWDILPRIVNCGIWKDVKIVKFDKDRINDVYIYPVYVKPNENKAKIRIIFDISISKDLVQEYKIRFSGKCLESEFCEEITPWGLQYGRMAFEIDNPKIWWPKGYGDANIYECKAELIYDNKTLFTYPVNFGLRTIQLVNTEANIDGNGKFEILINGKKIFCKGVNYSPLSPLLSEYKKRQKIGLEKLNSTNSNMVRIWGGGYYEDDDFFSFCDKNGIMVWQDFMMACAVYPQDNYFINNLEKEVEYQICKLRNHPSLVIWSGDNECDCTYNSWAGVIRNPNENIITRKVLPELVRKFDLSRPFLPSSPYISQLCFDNNYKTTEEHLWGNRPPYEDTYYKDSQCNFVSEIGIFGAISENSALQFIPKDYLYPLINEDGSNNRYWLAHATESMDALESPYKYRISLLLKLVKNYFSYIPDSYRELSILSQIIQSEGVKRFIEIFRSDQKYRSGIIYWNLMDGHGNISESLIDYYENYKLAYYYLKLAYEAVYLMIIKKNDEYQLIVSNTSNDDASIEYSVIGDTIKLNGEKFVSKSNTSEIIKTFTNLNEKNIYLIQWKYKDKVFNSHYIENIYNLDINNYLNTLKNNKNIPDNFDF